MAATSVVICPRLLSLEDVVFRLSSAFNRLPSQADYVIEEIWRRRLQSNPRLFNASKFRMAACSYDSACEKLILDLGVTNFKEFTATSSASFRSLVEGTGNVHLAMALGNESLTVCEDGVAVMYKRSEHVSSFAGVYCFPGGHPEPARCRDKKGGEELGDLGAAAEEMKAAQEVHNRVGKEFFSSAMEEVVEELGVPREAVSNLGLGGVHTSGLSTKPVACFVIKIALPSSEVARIFSAKKAVDSYEAEGNLFLCPLAELGGGTSSLQMTPATELCVQLGELFQERIQNAL